MSERIKIKLSYPVQFGSETIHELELRRPKAKDLRGLPLKMEMDHMLTLCGRVSGQPDSVINELDFDDTMKVVEVLGNFIGSSLPTGSQQ